MRTLAERFWKKVRKAGPDECWVWTASTDGRGYGKIHVRAGEPTEKAHRVSYRMHKGEPGDLMVCHTCDNPPCVNPAHLFLGTQTVNMGDCAAKGRSNAGTRNGQSKLEEPQVKEIVARRAAGESMESLAQAFGVGVSAIRLIIAGKRWRHVDRPCAVPASVAAGYMLKRGSECGSAKLNEEKVRDLISRRAAGERVGSLAERFGISIGTTFNILAGKTWAHVPGREMIDRERVRTNNRATGDNHGQVKAMRHREAARVDFRRENAC